MPKLLTLTKPYNIVVNELDNSAEINMYGEVVSARPTDWWTGEPIPGNFIALDEFLRDLDELSTKDSITVHINSVGGDMYAGIAIYNRLKGLAAKVTTINDGLAASAGSLIFMAGDTRKVNAGSNLMIHGAATLLWGYYQTQDLRSAIKQLEAHNKAGVNIYAERTGRPADEIKPLVDRETWMTGQDAVDQGFATEVIGDEVEPVNMMVAPDKSCVMVNGIAVAARCFGGKLPEGIPQMSASEWAKMSTPETSAKPAPQAPHNIQNKNGGKHMEIKNVDDLRKAYPDLVAQVETAAQASGVTAERARIQGIEEIENAIGDADLIRNAKYGEKPMNAEQLAFAAMKKQAAIGVNMVTALENDTKNSGAAAVVATPAPAGEPKAKTDDEKAEALLLGVVENMNKEVK